MIYLKELILRTFILVLMVNSIETHGKNLMGWEALIRSIMAHIIIMLVLINVGLILYILMVGFNGTLDIDYAEDL